MTDLILKAKSYAYMKHDGQTRDGGASYITHPEQVAEILAQVTHDEQLIAAGWLHDTLEDTDTKYMDLVREFGLVVANLVKEVTHVEDPGGSYFPYLKSREGIMLKFADRLSNLAGMAVWGAEQQQHYLNKSKFWNSEPPGTIGEVSL